MNGKEAIKMLRTIQETVYLGSCKFYEAIDVAIKTLEQPTIEPERKKGHWIKGKMWSEGIGMGETYGFYYTCSECNSSVQGGYDVCGKNFCEKCGADMREPEDIPMEYFESGGR